MKTTHTLHYLVNKCFFDFVEHIFLFDVQVYLRWRGPAETREVKKG